MDVLPWTGLSQEKWPRRKLVGKATITNGLRLGRSEFLRRSRQYLQVKNLNTSLHPSPRRDLEVQKEKYSTIVLERTYKRWTLKPFETPSIRNLFSGTLGDVRETGWNAFFFFFFSRARRYHLQLNWTELNSTETRTQTVGPATNLAALLDVGEHDDLCDALLPDHPPEVADAVGMRT